MRAAHRFRCPMTEHTRTDGLPELAEPQVLERARPRNERMATTKVECNACPILCQIAEGRTGACDRYANQGGVLIRVDPVVLLRKTVDEGRAPLVQFSGRVVQDTGDAAGEVSQSPDWDGDLLRANEVFVTGIGSSGRDGMAGSGRGVGVSVAAPPVASHSRA